MADFGGVGAGLGGLFQGAQEAIYRNKELDLRKEEGERAKKLLALQLAEHGYQESPTGSFERTAESKKDLALQKATTQAGLLKSGHKAVFNPETGDYDLQQIPGFHDLEQENKSLQNQRLRIDLAQGKKPAANEFAAAGYAKRLEDAESTFGELEKSGYDPSSVGNSIQKVGLFPGLLQGEDVKREEQAKTNFVNAILRRESGAAISKSEFDTANKQYFPQAGDTSAVLDQKKVNRRLAIEGIKAEGGRAYGKSATPEEVRGLISPTKKRGGLLSSADAAEPVDKVSSFMRKNGISSRQEAMKILKEHGKL